MPDPFRAAAATASVIGRHDVAIVLGSGWSAAAEAFGPATSETAYRDLDGFPVPTVRGHHGVARSVEVGPRRVLLLVGRGHLYEGHGAVAVVHPVRTAVAAGCSTVVLTNAAGAIRSDLAVGQPVLLTDHINLTGHNPLVGAPPPEGFASRFPDMTGCYSARLRAVAASADPTLAEGIYAALLGPSYETPAEIRMLRSMGADLVGMSTALEAIAAVHLGAEVLGISLVTNPAAGLAGPIGHDDVLTAGAGAAARLGLLLRSIVERL